MNIRGGTVFALVLTMIWLGGCGGGDCDNPNPNYDPNDPTSESCFDDALTEGGLSSGQAASISLTNALIFNNPGAITIRGEFPGETSSTTPQGEVTLAPGGSSTITTPATHPDDPNDPVVASLVWMVGSDSFVSLPSGEADSDDGDTLSNTFTVDASVCDNLCDIIHEVQCYEAAQTASGTITQANLTTVILECTGSGDPAVCPSSGGQGSLTPGPGGSRSVASDDCTDSGNPEACSSPEGGFLPSNEGTGQVFSGDICQLQCDLCEAGCDLQWMCEIFDSTCLSRCEDEKAFQSEYYDSIIYCLGGKTLTCENFIMCSQLN